MRKVFLSLSFVLSFIGLQAQELQIKENIINPSEQINDGQIEVSVTGGTPPYTYKWSNQSTSLNSPTSSGLTEGVEYTLTVTDAQGASVSGVYKVEAKSIIEIFNGFMTPAVAGLESVLFWDPFD